MNKNFLLLTAVVGLSLAAKAKTSAIAPANAEYIKAMDVTAGRFEYKLNEREAVNVNYSLSPKHPVDKAQFSLHTPDPMPFWANVTNASGKVVYTWKPENKVYLYNAAWDLSGLKAGDYTVNIYLDGQKNSVYKFSFSK